MQPLQRARPPVVSGKAEALRTRLLTHLTGLSGRLLVGVSGGADSMALAMLLTALRDQGRVELYAVHVNHGLRGEESDGDEAFVRDYCAAHDIPLEVFRLTPPAHPGEAWAREARYAAFDEAYRAVNADALALAHHRDDQAETLIMHLMRGSGLDGLCGMRRESTVRQMRVLRPLLNASRTELVDLLEACGQPWREDATNAGDDYLRNRVRHELMPLLERLAPGAATRIASTAAQVAGDAELLQEQTAGWLDRQHGLALPLQPLMTLQEGLRIRVLRAWWLRETHRPPLDSTATKALHALLQQPVGARISLPGGLHAYRGWHFVHLTGLTQPVTAEYQLSGAGEYRMGGAVVAIGGSQGHFGNGRTVQELPERMLDGCVLRTRREGDWIRPFGMQGRQSLQDYFVNRHVDEPFRDRVPLVCRGSEVLFACGIGAGAIPRWSEHEQNIRISAAGEMPWATMY